MEPKNRLVIAAAVIIVIVVALLTSFGRSLFVLNTPQVVLPDLGDASTGDGSSSGSQSTADQYQRVEVTPETVQSVIATLTRSDSYYRELTVETFWGDGSSSVAIQVWADGGMTHSRQALPSGAARHDLVADGTLYYWYEGSTLWQSAPADERSSDLSQRLPTYETVLELDTESITAAGYELRGDLPCVYVEVALGESGQRERYWVSVDNGLLAAAEAEQDGQLTYRMTAYAPLPIPADASFMLPDGSSVQP